MMETWTLWELIQDRCLCMCPHTHIFLFYLFLLVTPGDQEDQEDQGHHYPKIIYFQRLKMSIFKIKMFNFYYTDSW